MLSGNGRHRRPRQAPALLVAAGVTGSAIAIPLLGATGASAASGATWDKIAECESGGSWSADTGNGRYGGLQLSQEDWEQYGGLDYAPRADQASRSQQIAVAERVLADQGVGVWRTCGLLYGLDDDSGSPDVDTGVAGDSYSSSERSTKADPGQNDSGGTTAGDAGGSGTDSVPGTDADASNGGDSDKSGQNGSSSVSGESGTNPDESSSSGSEGEASGTGRHRGGSADEGAADGHTDAATGSTGRHASQGADSAGTFDVTDGSYVVRAGDNLWAIADSLGLPGGWGELYDENRGTVGTDPGLIRPGQRLNVGDEPGEK